MHREAAAARIQSALHSKAHTHTNTHTHTHFALASAHAHTEELQQLTKRVAHVMPVSDDGGSTAEIVRVLGGPAVGDIRSRCLRLADSSDVEVRVWPDQATR